MPPNFHVKISDRLLEQMTLATAEAYVLGDGNHDIGLETLGYIWGHRIIRDEGNEIFFHLDRASISISAIRNQDWVQPNQTALHLKNAIVTRWAPEVTLLGDFHSHPYSDFATVQAIQGWQFSDSDIQYFLENNDTWELAENNPIMVAMTICKMGAVHGNVFGDMQQSNVFRFDIGEFRFWINVIAGWLDNKGARQHTPNIHSSVFLDMIKFFNEAGDRLEFGQ